MRYQAFIVVLMAMLICMHGQPVHAQSGSTLHSFKQRKEAAISALRKYPVADTNRINALINIFTTASFLKERQEVLPYRIEAMGLSRRLNYIKGLAFCYSSTGNYHKSLMEYPVALKYFDSVLYITNGTAHPKLLELRSGIQRQIGAVHVTQGNYYMALDHLFESLKYEEGRSKDNTITINIHISDIYATINNLEKATEYALRNIELVKDDTSWSEQAGAYFPLIDILLIKQDFSTAIQYLDKIAPHIPDQREIQLNYGYYLKMGQLNYLQQKYQDAYSYFQRTYKYAMLGGHKLSRSMALRRLSSTALKLGDQEAARKYAMENFALAEEINTKAERIEALSNLSAYYKVSGDNVKALELMQQAMKLKDSVMAETNTKQINILGAIYEAEKQEKEINRLQIEKEKQTATARHQSFLNKLFIASIIILLITGYLGYSNFRRGQQLAKQRDELQKQKIIELEKDKQLLTIDAMLKGQEEERSRIAKDLHDGLGSMLSGTKLSFMNVKEKLLLSPEYAGMFDKSLSMLDNTIGDLRKVAQNLMPEALVKFGLTDAVRDFCDSIQSTSGLRVLYTSIGEIRRLDNTAEVFIYRIIQELVTNVVKHAEATQVIVQLAMSNDKIVITVEDNGKGFDQEIFSRTRGMGMTNIKYRLQYFNGTLDIVTSPGNGASVNIELMV
jgi:two-component system, NarL family, sensor kinase